MAVKNSNNVYSLDPIQGHDVKVTSSPYDMPKGDQRESSALMNAFTDIMIKVVVQTETFLPLNRNVPRFLDGEVIIVWSASAGVLDFNFISETFGPDFARSVGLGKRRVSRSRRFKLTAAIDLYNDEGQETLNDAEGHPEAFNNPAAVAAKGENAQLTLLMCRCDTLTFGIQAGKGYAVNSWQGTAEGIKTPKFVAGEIKEENYNDIIW